VDSANSVEDCRYYTVCSGGKSDRRKVWYHEQSMMTDYRTSVPQALPPHQLVFPFLLIFIITVGWIRDRII